MNRKSQPVVRRRWLVLAACLLASMAPGASFGALQGLTSSPPDIVSDFITVSFDQPSGAFTADGFAEAFDLDGIAPPDYTIGGTQLYSINLTLDSYGVPLGGTLNVSGTIVGLGATSGNLLSGQISQFDFMDAPGGETFELIFTVTGGDLAGYFTSGEAAVILNAFDSGFTGTFDASFANWGLGVADTFDNGAEIPEPPATTAILLLGFFGIWGGRAIHRRRQSLRCAGALAPVRA